MCLLFPSESSLYDNYIPVFLGGICFYAGHNTHTSKPDEPYSSTLFSSTSLIPILQGYQRRCWGTEEMCLPPRAGTCHIYIFEVYMQSLKYEEPTAYSLLQIKLVSRLTLTNKFYRATSSLKICIVESSVTNLTFVNDLSFIPARRKYTYSKRWHGNCIFLLFFF